MRDLRIALSASILTLNQDEAMIQAEGLLSSVEE